MTCRGRIFPIIALLGLGALNTSASDLPFKGNLAARETIYIERGFFAVPERNTAAIRIKSVFADKMVWKVGALKVCFWNGDDETKKRVAGIADELTAGLPIKFIWQENGAFVRCPGNREVDTSWSNYEVRVSLLHAPGLLKPGDDATAFFGLVGRQKSGGRLATVNLPFQNWQGKEEIRNLVLHEFCHVLGCLHEHQRELCTKDFDAEKIQEKFRLSPQEYVENFLEVPSSHAYGAAFLTGFDNESVMLYRLTPDLFRKGSKSECMVSRPASELSPLDKSGLRSMYGRAADGAGLKLADFARLEKNFRAQATVQQMLANKLRDAARIGSGEPGVSAASLRSRANAAEAIAAEANAEADSYVLTEDQLAAIERALAYFPED